MEEKPCYSVDTIPTDYSEDEINTFTNKMLSEGWIAVATSEILGFISPDGSWYRGLSKKGRCDISMPREHAKRIGFCGTYEEKK